MNTYRVEFDITVKWRSRDSHSITVTADSEAEAEHMAEALFNSDYDPDPWDATVADIDSDISRVECIEENTACRIPYRCPATADLFGSARPCR